ncbi:MAG: DUF4349 domain-containing protein [Acidimicrobiales bacterium]
MALLVVAACSGSGDDQSTSGEFTGDWDAADDGRAGESEGGGSAADGDDMVEAPEAAPPGGDGSEQSDTDGPGRDGSVSGPQPVVLTAADMGRSIVYTATLDIVADDVAAATRDAQQAIAGIGGLVFGQETTTDPRPRTTLVFKVAPADFGEAISRLEGVGEMVDQEISADDVTDRVVDLQSRIRSNEISVDRLRELLGGATTVEAIASLEAQLLDRETTLETLRGQLRTLEGQVSLATITVTISEEVPPAARPAVEVEVTGYVGDDDGDRCPGDRELTVDEGDGMVLCVAITNTGNAALSEIEVRDPGLDLRRDAFTLLDLAEGEVLEVDETVIAWARFDASLDRRSRPDVSAVPVDDDGEPVRQSVTTELDPLVLDVVEDDSLPGLVDSLGTGWGAVQRVVGVAIVVLGVAAPLMVLAVPAAWFVWTRRRGDRDDTPADDGPTSAPVPA